MQTFAVTIAFTAMLASACTAQADGPKSTNKGPDAKAIVTPDVRARTVLDTQLKALPSDNAALRATLTRDAGVFVPNFGVKLDDPDIDIGAQIASMNPHAQMKGAKVTRLVAGGNASMVWFAADLEIVVLSSEPGEQASSDTHAIRAVEVLDAASEWKVVAASFTEIRPLRQLREPRGPIPLSTPAGPLARLLASPDGLANSLANDPVVVFGTEATERAVGQRAAKTLLGKWRKLPLAIEEVAQVREVHTNVWGYAMAIVNIPKPGDYPFRMSAFVVAIPGAGGAWSVVAASYGAL